MAFMSQPPPYIIENEANRSLFEVAGETSISAFPSKRETGEKRNRYRITARLTRHRVLAPMVKKELNDSPVEKRALYFA